MPKDSSLRTLSLAATFALGVACDAPKSAPAHAPPEKEQVSSTVAAASPLTTPGKNQNYADLRDVIVKTKDGVPITFDFIAVHRAGVYEDGAFEAHVRNKLATVIGEHSLLGLDGDKQVYELRDKTYRTRLAKDTALTIGLSRKILSEISTAIGGGTPVTCNTRADGQVGKFKAEITAQQLRVIAGLQKAPKATAPR